MVCFLLLRQRLDSLIVLQRSGATGDCLVQNMKTRADFLALGTRTWGAVPTGTPLSTRGKSAPARGEIREVPRLSYLPAAACPSRSPGICGDPPRTSSPGSSYCDTHHRPPPSCAWRSEPPCPPRSRSAGPSSWRCNLSLRSRTAHTRGGGAAPAPRRSRTSARGCETLTRPDHPR